MSTPKFLIGGINFSKNFFGIQTIKAGVWTGIETGIKTLPILLTFIYLGKSFHYIYSILIQF